jgi:hypothetical protein
MSLEFLHSSPFSKGDAALFVAVGSREDPLLISPLFALQGGESIGPPRSLWRGRLGQSGSPNSESLPRYPSVPGRLRAKKKPLQTAEPQRISGGLEMIRLKTPPDQGSSVQILGSGPEAAPQIVGILQELGLL